MSPFTAVKYGLLAAAALLIVAAGLFAADQFVMRRSVQQQEDSDLAARRVMMRLWAAPISEPEPHEIKKLLVLCVYSSPHTRDDVSSWADTYRFLDLWQEAIRRDGPETAEAIVRRCRANPALVDPTPPQILQRNAIISGHG